MAKKTWDVLILILEIAIEVVVLIKDKILSGGKNDNRSGSSAKA